jgi:GDP-L-fucose synthase
MWGTGSPRREFLHVDDLAKACLHLLEKYDDDIAINVGSGEDVEIKELALIVANAIGFDGEIHWDTTRPDGTPRKLLDVSKIKATGWAPTIDLATGISDLIDWYYNNI